MFIKKFENFLNNEKYKRVQTWFCLICMILIVMNIAIMGYQTYDYVKLQKDYNSMLAEYKENLGDSVEVAQVISEINTIYDKYAIKNNPNFSLANDYALNYYVDGLNDKYATYFRPEDFESYTNKDNDYQVGIGISFVYENGIGLRIDHIYEDSPAYKSGLKVGDYITHADGTYVEDVDVVTFVDSISGKEGEDITLTVLRGNESIDYTLTRAKYDIESVVSKDIEGVAYVRINKFAANTSQKFKSAMNNFNEQNFEKYIIDLRNNSGGHLETIVDILDFMVGEGKIVSIVDCNGEENYEYISDKNEFNGDIVVLVNGNTASASELFAQTMKDFNKATIIGTQTFGKGTVVGVYNLTNGGAIMLSTGIYETKSGTHLEGVGVTPDVKLEMSDTYSFKSYEIDEFNDNQLRYALDYLNK